MSVQWVMEGVNTSAETPADRSTASVLKVLLSMPMEGPAAILVRYYGSTV